VLNKLVVEQPPKDKKGHLTQIAEIARRFCTLGSAVPSLGEPVVEITDEKELMEAISRVLGENKTLRNKLNEQAQRIAYLEELATSDELTQVLNRRGFEAELKRILARAKRTTEHGALAYIDLDEFKPINDTYGHAAGDEVLRKVANILVEKTRDTDVVGRLGGDEFAIILVNTSRESVLDRAEALNKLLNEASITWEGHRLTIHASFGLQAYQSDDDADYLLKSADAAMYKIKQIKETDGRRRIRPVVLNSPDLCHPEAPRMVGNAQGI
jgi:diguanylate cyclase (GGDEF)-like protein